MPSALSIIGAIALIGAGSAAGLAWDRHPPLGWHAHILFWSPGFDLAPSLLTQLDQAAADRQRALKATSLCQLNLDGQNKDIAASADLDARMIAKATAELNSTRSEVVSLIRASASLKTYQPQGADACARWTDADRMVTMLLGAP